MRKNTKLDLVLVLTLALFSSACLKAGLPSSASSYFASTNLFETGAQQFAGKMLIVNQNTSGTDVSISSAGLLFKNKQQLLSFIENFPPLFPGEPNYQKAWRLVTVRGYGHIPFTGDFQVYDPLLYLNSLGYGFCDNMANVLAIIWRWQGYQSRVWWLSGHVVPEVNINSKWIMFDPDFGVYYRDASHDIVGVEELETHPELITQPIDPVYRPAPVYEQLLASFYSTVENNRVTDPPIVTSIGMDLTLPPSSTFVFPVASDPNAFSFPGETRSSPLYYLAQLSIPKVEQHVDLDLPLFVVGISGSGSVMFNGNRYDVGSVELQDYFANFSRENGYPRPITSMTLFEGANNIVINMSISAFAVNGAHNLETTVYPEANNKYVSAKYIGSGNAAPSPVGGLIREIANRPSQTPYQFTSPFDLGATISGLVN